MSAVAGMRDFKSVGFDVVGIQTRQNMIVAIRLFIKVLHHFKVEVYKPRVTLGR